MVFMNMGGPSTTDEVGDFLSRLFVCVPGQRYRPFYTPRADQMSDFHRQTEI